MSINPESAEQDFFHVLKADEIDGDGQAGDEVISGCISMDGIKNILEQPSSLANGGMLVSFESSEPRYSYAEADGNMIVKRTAEKEVISSHALCGAYFFSSAKGFLKAAHRLMNEPVFTKPEYYVSLLYNYLLADGETVKLAQMEEYHSYGTPEELRKNI